MDRRKVQRTGGSTFIVSLPKKWIDAHAIQPGDALDVDAHDDGPVTIWPAGRRTTVQRTLPLEIDPTEPTSHTERLVIAAYLAGYDSIVVTAKGGRFPAEQKEAVRRLAQALIGIEIVEESLKSITLQDLLDPVDFNLSRALDRMQQLTRSMVADAFTALRTGEHDLATDIPRRDPEVDRLDWMIVKQFHLISSSSRLATELHLGPSDALHYLLVSTALERIADHAGRLAEVLNDKGGRALPQGTREALADYGDTVLTLLDRAFSAFQKSEIRAANETLSTCRDVQTRAPELLARGKGQPAIAQVSLALLVKSIERVRSYTMDIAEAAIDHHMIHLGRRDSTKTSARRP